MENSLLIKVICGKGKLCQHSTVKIGLEITNIGKEPLIGCTIKNFRLESEEQKGVAMGFNEEFHIELNPNETKMVWAKGKNTIILYGLVSAIASLVPDNHDDTIKTYQEDIITGEIDENKKINFWLDVFYIESIFEKNQRNTNKILVIFTTLTALCTIIMTILTYFIFIGK